MENSVIGRKDGIGMSFREKTCFFCGFALGAIAMGFLLFTLLSISQHTFM